MKGTEKYNIVKEKSRKIRKKIMKVSKVLKNMILKKKN